MDEPDDSHPQPKRVNAEAKRLFLEALRAGAPRDEAAAAAGFTAEAFYYARKRDPVFRLAWLWALALSAQEERAARASAAALAIPPLEGEIAPNANRLLQRRPRRRALFTAAGKRLFLDHFAGTADAHAAAEAAQVAYPTIVAHRLRDPDFAAAWDEALATAYAALEAEALRQRLEGQRLLREEIVPAGEMAKEFDRVMQLLARYERRGGTVGLREVRRGRERSWTFDEAITALGKKLDALGVRRGLLPQPQLPPPSPDAGQ